MSGLFRKSVCGAAVLTAVLARAAETPVVRGAEKAVLVSENVAGAEEVKLTATVGPDTYDFVWISMRSGGSYVFCNLPNTLRSAFMGLPFCGVRRSSV